METTDTLVAFMSALAARGITLRLRKNRVNAGASQKLLTPEERAFMNQHRAALKELLSNPQRVQRKSVAEPPPEPEPVMWTDDYETRITAEHVAATGVPPGLSKREAYERAKQWLEEQERKRKQDWMIQSRHNAARGGPSRGCWEDFAYD